MQYHDAVCRHDLHQGLITSERDYVSNLATHLRYPLGSLINTMPASAIPKPAYHPPITSLTLPTSSEQLFGCDGIIVLIAPPKDENSDAYLYKVGMFEAKWPRISKPNYPWDKKSYHGHSHFSYQLARQHALASVEKVVLWEMFFSEEAVGNISGDTPFPWGSTCIWHKDAWNHMLSNINLAHVKQGSAARQWTSADLRALIAASTVHSLASVIEGMASCNIGEPIEGNSGGLSFQLAPNAAQFLFNSEEGKTSPLTEPINIPVLNRNNDLTEIQNFMRKYGFRSYTSIMLDEEAIRAAMSEAKQARMTAMIGRLDKDAENQINNVTN